MAFKYDPAVAQYGSAAEWALGMLHDLRDDKLGRFYNEGYSARESEAKRKIKAVTLGSGEAATLVRAEFTMNGNKRQVAYLSNERTFDDTRIWYAIFFANSRKHADQADWIAVVSRGVGYINQPSAGASGSAN